MKVAAVIYHPSSRKILTGVESFYCFEETNPHDIDIIRKMETCSEQEAIHTAIELSNTFQLEIRYSEFQSSRTHFCCLSSNSHMGIIKGNVDRCETLEHAIIREIEEEVGLIVPESRLIPNKIITIKNTNLFFIPIDTMELKMINRHIKERKKRHCGEIFRLGFRNLLSDYKYPLNQITRSVKKWLETNPEMPDPVCHDTLSLTSLLPIETKVIQPYLYSYIKEPSFVWNRTRKSLLPLPELI